MFKSSISLLIRKTPKTLILETKPSQKTKKPRKRLSLIKLKESVEAKNPVVQYRDKIVSRVKKRFCEVSMEQQIELFKKALKSCGGEQISDIYNYSYDKFTKSPEGTFIFGYYSGSIVGMCYSLFPDYKWVPWLFKRNSDRSWRKQKADYNYYDEIIWYAALNDITESNLDKWYDISIPKFKEACKTKIDCEEMRNFIQKAYPHHKFYKFKFCYAPISIWDDPNVIADYRKFLYQTTGFKMMEQFYLLSPCRIKKLYGGSLLKKLNGSQYQLYRLIFPEFPWVEEYLHPDFIKKLASPPPKEPKKISSFAQFFDLGPTQRIATTFDIPEKEIQKNLSDMIENNLNLQ
ncbi:hypothetical protein RB653_008299 [Dictyostelium firmibasis]|uniref:Uncharacterized protein n=1 Tax=Dictyostelium firmibasis TaxID=79012 RepID=A0AAN7TQU2_9MYCE